MTYEHFKDIYYLVEPKTLDDRIKFESIMDNFHKYTTSEIQDMFDD